jgi:hypothetical protein
MKQTARQAALAARVPSPSRRPCPIADHETPDLFAGALALAADPDNDFFAVAQEEQEERRQDEPDSFLSLLFA